MAAGRRFVVSQCNALLRSEEWLEARAALGMPPLPGWEHGEDQCLLSHALTIQWCLHAPVGKCTVSLLNLLQHVAGSQCVMNSDLLPSCSQWYHTHALVWEKHV